MNAMIKDTVIQIREDSYLVNGTNAKVALSSGPEVSTRSICYITIQYGKL